MDSPHTGVLQPIELPHPRTRHSERNKEFLFDVAKKTQKESVLFSLERTSKGDFMRAAHLNKAFVVIFILLFVTFLLRGGRVHASDIDAAGKIAFVGNQSGSFQLYTMNPDGSHMVQITNLAPTPLETWVPDFSPDGKRITFSYGQPDANGFVLPDIYVIDADGSNLTQITHDGLSGVSRWSPDGTRLTFLRQSTRINRGVVATMRVDGSDQKILTTDLWGVFRSGYTPDGSHILWETQEAGFVSVLWIMNSDGTNQKRLTQAPLKAGLPSSPAGDSVVFMGNQNTPTVIPTALYRMHLDGSDVDQLTQPVGDSHDGWPNFSPSRQKIVFTSDRLSSDGSLDIFTMNADGSGILRIASGVTVGGCPDDNCVNPAWGRSPH
jgi:Tol biopolymer transport system component